MNVPEVNNNVKKLLLNPKFLEWVFGSPCENPNARSGIAKSMKSLLKKYRLGDILDAKCVLLHLEENQGYFSDMDIEELRKRLSNHLKRLK